MQSMKMGLGSTFLLKKIMVMRWRDSGPYLEATSPILNIFLHSC